MFNALCCLVPGFLPVQEKRLESNLKSAGFTCTSSQYVSTCLLLSLFSLAVLYALFSFIADVEVYYAFPAGLLIFTFLSYFPHFESKRIENEFNSLLPLAVYMAYIDTKNNVPPEQIINSLGTSQVFRHKFSNAAQLLSAGCPTSLLSANANGDYKKFLEALTRGNAVELKKLYGDLLAAHTAAVKTYSAKANLTGMFFISIAGVIPAMFAGVSILGPNLGFTFTAGQTLLMFVLVFPLLNFAFLYYIHSTSVTSW